MGYSDSMEAAANVAAARSGSLRMPSPSRKEWRAVSDHQAVRNPGDEVVISSNQENFCFRFYPGSEKTLR